MAENEYQEIARKHHNHRPRKLPAREQYGKQRRHAVAQRQAGHHPEDAYVAEIEQGVGKRHVGIAQSAENPAEPCQGESDEENHHRAAKYLGQGGPGEREIIFAQGEVGGHAHDEHKEGEYQVGGREAVPLGVAKRSVDVAPRAGIVDKNHARDGDAAEYVEGEQPASFIFRD